MRASLLRKLFPAIRLLLALGCLTAPQALAITIDPECRKVKVNQAYSDVVAPQLKGMTALANAANNSAARFSALVDAGQQAALVAQNVTLFRGAAEAEAIEIATSAMETMASLTGIADHELIANFVTTTVPLVLDCNHAALAVSIKQCLSTGASTAFEIFANAVEFCSLRRQRALHNGLNCYHGVFFWELRCKADPNCVAAAYGLASFDTWAIADRCAGQYGLEFTDEFAYDVTPSALQCAVIEDLLPWSVVRGDLERLIGQFLDYLDDLAEKDCAILPPAPLAAPTALSATAVSSSRINLTWQDRSLNESGFGLERRPATSAVWTEIVKTAPNSTSYSDPNREPGTQYKYRVRAYGTSLAPSLYSNEASATTPAPSTATLYFRSLNPSSDVLVQTWVNSTQVELNTTPTTTQRNIGATVGIACAPSLGSGKVFQKWLLDGVDYAFTNLTAVVLDGDHILTAVYGSAPLPPRTLSSLAIEGPSSVNERSSAQYTSVATFTDGSSSDVVASWSVEGTGYATISTTGRFDTAAVTNTRSVEIYAQYTVDGVSRGSSKNISILNVDIGPTYTLNLSAMNGNIGQSPSLGSYSSGTEVRLIANPDRGYVFSHWSGDATGTSRTTYVTMNSNKSVMASFVPNPTQGTLRVQINPPAANQEGARWKAMGNDYYPVDYTPTSESRILDPGRYYVHYKGIPGWVEPENHPVDVIGGETTTVQASYRELKGVVQTTILPDAARTVGARWRLDGGAWRESGTTLSDIARGSHTVEFSSVPGWLSPAPRTITVERSKTTLQYGEYSPPPGTPLITSISPAVGPLAGGTAVTIDGANFREDATVTFGGISAASVSVQSPTRLIAFSPPRASYGTVAVSVISNGQTATRQNGFSYLNVNGANIELLGQIGGDVAAVAVHGGTVFYGEGAGLVIANFADPASPVEFGRIALPGFVKDIHVADSVAFVADNTAGLYAVDVADPTSPAIIGFYDLGGAAFGLDVLQGLAYVADAGFGLRILDVSDPTAMYMVGSLQTGKRAERVAAGTIGAKTYAFLVEGNGAFRVIDVTNAEQPVEVNGLSAESGGGGFVDVRLVGSTVYVSDFVGQVTILDVTGLPSLTEVGKLRHVGASHIDVAPGLVYACSGIVRVVETANLPVATELGVLDAASGCNDVVASGGLAFMAAGRQGLLVIDVSNPDNLSLRANLPGVGWVHDVFVAGQLLVAGTDYGLHTIDISNPAHPVWLATLAGERVTDVVVVDRKALLVDYGEDEVRIVDIADASQPHLLGTYRGIEAYDVALLNSTPILVGATLESARRSALHVLDISNPSSPTSAGQLILGSGPGSAMTAAAANNWAFVAAEEGLRIVDLSDPEAPVTPSGFPWPTFMRDLAMTENGEFAYLPGPDGVHIVDARDKAALAAVSLLDPPQSPGSWSTNVEVRGQHLYFDNTTYLFAFDIADPQVPEMLGYYRVPAPFYGMSAEGDLMVVAGTQSGISILRLRDVDSPTVTIASPTFGASFATNTEYVTLSGVASDDQQIAEVTWASNRGGGGTAMGTTAWTVTDIPLGSGLNRITVTAEDAEGNHGTDVLEIVATFADTTAPVVTITGPRPDSEFSVESDAVDLVGTAVDNEGVVAVVWEDSLGDSGLALLGDDTFMIANLPLHLGPNPISIIATDASGNIGRDDVLIFMSPPDTQAPSVSIDFPTANAEMETAFCTLNLSGVSIDDVGVKKVEWANSRGGSGVAQGGTIWSVNDIELQAGLNVIDVTAYDDADNPSQDTLSVTQIRNDRGHCVGVDCGDGVVGLTEDCDDGNLDFAPGEYCAADCHSLACGKPTNSSGATPVASDALFVLRAAVGQVACDKRVCDSDDSGGITATDALRVLRAAVGQPVTLACPQSLMASAQEP